MTLRVLAASLALAIALPPLDPWFDATMPRHLLLQAPLLLVLGYLAAQGSGEGYRAWNPWGLTGLVWCVCAVTFWMIPRSVDIAVASSWADLALHVSLFSAGAALALSAPQWSWLAKTLLGIQGTAMLLAVGAVYAQHESVLCAAYTLAQQHATGDYLMGAAAVLWLAMIGRSAAILLGSEASRDAHA